MLKRRGVLQLQLLFKFKPLQGFLFEEFSLNSNEAFAPICCIVRFDGVLASVGDTFVSRQGPPRTPQCRRG